MSSRLRRGLTLEQGDYAGAHALHEESLAIMRELGDRRGVAWALAGLAWVAIDERDHRAERDLHLESLEMLRELEDRRGIALGHRGLGHIAAVQGDPATARIRHEESLAILQELGDTRNIAWSLVNLGWVAIDQGDHVRARDLLAESLTIARELGDARVVVDALEISSYLSLVIGRVDRAARLQGAAEALRETIGSPLSPSEHAGYDGEVAAVRAALGELEFAAAWAEGRAMTLEQSVAYALEAPTST